ncbi:MAG: hypothetical protein COY02_03760, partial [Parcubacteria group bacterium CG_4_10_14_0_2_um_filter_41_6]
GEQIYFEVGCYTRHTITEVTLPASYLLMPSRMLSATSPYFKVASSLAVLSHFNVKQNATENLNYKIPLLSVWQQKNTS